MLELPECYVLSSQLKDKIKGKRIINVFLNLSPHKFAWFSGSEDDYRRMLTDRKITGIYPGTKYSLGGFIEIEARDSVIILSAYVRYHEPESKRPAKNQLLIDFEDGSSISCSVQMYGGLFCYPTDNIAIPYYRNKIGNPNPLQDGFDMDYFYSLRDPESDNLSVKAFLSTNGRIPGLGNGVLQDILYNTGINPMRKMCTVSSSEYKKIYCSIKETLKDMYELGGRDTEKDIYGKYGGYKTKMSKKTVEKPCPVCGGEIIKKAYLGGSVYYCPSCQKI